jgi:2-C-methyl-D-erythritol 4-phosphate cytidylyltransferase
MNKNDLITFLVLAAGVGRRFGGELPKQYQTLAGHPVLWHTLKTLQDHPLVGQIIPIIAPAGRTLWDEIMGPEIEGMSKLSAPVSGGAERQFSVANGLASLKVGEQDWVAIHDGARPVLSHAMLERLFTARKNCNALLAALPANDTIKEVGPGGLVTKTLDRDAIWLAQTPQLFHYGLIMKAHQLAVKAGFMGTDDASLLEWLGEPVHTVLGESSNIKITNQSDMPLAAWLLAEKNRGAK